MKLVILGTRVFSEEVADLVRQSGEYELAAFGENRERERCERPLEGLPVIWVDDLERLAADHRAVCALSTTRRSLFVEQAAAAGLEFATVTHPSAVVSPSAQIGSGSIVGAGVVVAAHARVGAHVILNRGVLVGHHTTIGEYVTLSPGANVAGCLAIGDGTFVGMGATVLDRVNVGRGAVIGAGAVVTKDVPDNVRVLGVPARVVRRDVDGR